MEHPEPPRYTDRPFPAYRFLPFQDDPERPHPRNDPAGHSYQEKDEHLPPFVADAWRECGPYLYGVDLFNYGYWWEAHEAFEAVWMVAGQKATRQGRFLQGLIQLAAAQLKRVMGAQRGAEFLTGAGCEKLSEVDGVYLGIDVAALVGDAKLCFAEDCGEFPSIELRF
ncbi:MAG: hypothetical protein C0616_14105 [Desulfuromonas sp.]|nr:MAG: hypothetical protein C0616_14105 [Desulfuromonas sp.]